MSNEKIIGAIYILTNPSFPDYVKIGYANDVDDRLQKLNRKETTPYAFRKYAIYHVTKELTDKELHKIIDKLNPDLRSSEIYKGRKRVREFYAMSKEDAYEILESIAKISGTLDRLERFSPNEQEISNEQTAKEIQEVKRPRFRFNEYDIPIGSELTFKDDSNIVVKVVDDSHIEYNGETTSLSALARKIKQFDHNIQGTLWFCYKDEVLTDYRDRIDRERNQDINN